MDKEKEELIWTAFDDARPHISETEWLHTKISEITENTETSQEFIKLLREEEEKLTDPVKRTDIRIYLAQFQRYITKD